MKKTLLILLTLIIGISLNTKAHGFSIDYNEVTIYYEITSSTSPRTVSITYEGDIYSSFNNEYSGAISIPDSVLFNNIYYKVTSIDDGAFYNCSGLTSITIPNSITSIGDYAFLGCSGLTSIAMPNSITSIGNYAFSSCSGLTSILIPSSVTSIGGMAFDGTPYYNNIPNGVVYINNILYGYKGTMPANTILNIQAGIINISPYAFFDCSGLTSITIPTSVTSIGNSAFDGCTSLYSITIPTSVTSIGNYAFRDCSILASITIPNSVTSIGNSAFDGTPYFNNKPNGVVYVNDVLYKYKGTMPANTIINIQTGTINISQNAFYQCTGLTSITIPNSVTSIGDEAFSVCTGLTSIAIPNSVTSIGEGAFMYCSGLTSITIPNAITSISDYAFYGCTGLTSITIPNSVTSIGSCAFSGCSGLTSITIPDSVSYLGRKTFAGCVGLTSITCNAIIPPVIFTYSFQNVDKSIPLYVPCNSISIYQQYQYWSDFTNYRCTSGLGDELKLSTSAKLYPNPTNNKSKLEVEGLISEADVIVSDLLGRVIKSYKINKGNNELEIDVNGFAKGIYNIRIMNDKISISRKLIVN